MASSRGSNNARKGRSVLVAMAMAAEPSLLSFFIIIIAVSHTGIPGVKEKKHTETTEDKD